MAPGKKLSKKEIVEEMVDRYKGSPAEAEFQIATFLRLLVSLDFAEKDIKGKYSLLR